MELKNILGGKIMEATDECYQIAKMHYPGLSENFYYSLAVHLSAAYERLLNKKSIINPAIEKIKRNYETEYKIAGVMASKVSKMLMVDIPDEEVGFIAMYIKNFSHRLKTEDKVNVVLLTH
ncbi:MAG TPA: transcriptional regulator, partial [Eubacteriaceae bacterium]|nr:transcriptional regulator [Eubacteriaceae bacterium]